jgi:hypothetical protein
MRASAAADFGLGLIEIGNLYPITRGGTDSRTRFGRKKRQATRRIMETNPMRNGIATSALTTAFLSTCFFAASASAYSGEKLASGAKITMMQAVEIAMKARPGKITDKELEREGGGSGLRYSFDIRSKKVTYEVGVDAQTGTVLENGREALIRIE